MTTAKIDGADAFKALIEQIGAMGDADLLAAGDDEEDARDYRAMSGEVLASIRVNLLEHPDADHREGYLRALVHMLSLTADGSGISRDWEPIRDTEASFSR